MNFNQVVSCLFRLKARSGRTWDDLSLDAGYSEHWLYDTLKAMERVQNCQISTLENVAGALGYDVEYTLVKRERK